MLHKRIQKLIRLCQTILHCTIARCQKRISSTLSTKTIHFLHGPSLGHIAKANLSIQTASKSLSLNHCKVTPKNMATQTVSNNPPVCTTSEICYIKEPGNELLLNRFQNVQGRYLKISLKSLGKYLSGKRKYNDHVLSAR